MHLEIIISGFGGQGSLFAGQLLAYAAVEAGKHVTWIPSYGPEIRGGTAHCTVVISDEPIGSPLVRRPGAVVALNLPSFRKYEELLKPGGILVYNRSLIEAHETRSDVQYYGVPANAVAESLGNVRQANVVLLGALLQNHGGVAARGSRTGAGRPSTGASEAVSRIQQRGSAARCNAGVPPQPLEPTQRGV